MDFVVQRGNIHVRPVRAPAHGRHRASNRELRNRFLPTIVTTLPYTHGAVVGTRRQEFRPRPARKRSVEGVDDPAVGSDFTGTRARGYICHNEDVVRADSVEERGEERPLEVHNRAFVQGREEAVVIRWRVCPP